MLKTLDRKGLNMRCMLRRLQLGPGEIALVTQAPCFCPNRTNFEIARELI